MPLIAALEAYDRTRLKRDQARGAAALSGRAGSTCSGTA
jgi:hypothetical protein